MTGHFLSRVFIMLVVGAAGGVINYLYAGLETVARKRIALALHHVRRVDDVPDALHTLDIWQYLERRQ